MNREEARRAGLTRRQMLSLGAGGVAGLALAAGTHPAHAQQGKPRYGGRVRVGERFGSTGLDAHKNQWFVDFQSYVLMYNALTIMGPLPQVEIYPDLAKSWDISRDGREYTFPLREGVKFHHGKELDSGDVKYSIERVLNPATRAPRAFAYRWIDSVHAVDKYHVRIKLKEPFGPFLSTLTIQNCPIIPAGWEPTGTKPAPGTGPFVFKSFVPNETTEFTRFDKYWEVDEQTGMRLPYLDAIQVRKILDPVVRWTALRAGDLEYIQDPPKKAVVDAVKSPVPGVTVVVPQPVGNQWIYFNTTKPPFDNPKARQAFAYAVDKNELVKAAHWGLAEAVNNQPFLNRSRMYIPVADREVDVEKAKRLLAEAGHPNGFKVEFFQSSGTTYNIDACQVILGQVSKIGIQGTMKVLDRAAYVEAMRKGDYSVSVQGDSERLDPDDAYYLYLHSSEIGKDNYSRYSNKTLDALLEKARTTWNWDDRVPIYREVVQTIQADVPILYLAKTIISIAYRDFLKGHGAGAATWFGYYGGGMKKVWLDKS